MRLSRRDTEMYILFKARELADWLVAVRKAKNESVLLVRNEDSEAHIQTTDGEYSIKPYKIINGKSFPVDNWPEVCALDLCSQSTRKMVQQCASSANGSRVEIVFNSLNDCYCYAFMQGYAEAVGPWTVEE